MKKIVITNNKKVQAQFADVVEVRYMENASAYDVYEECKKMVEKGSKLLMDPTSGNIKSYYKSLVLLEGDGSTPDVRTLELLETCLQASKDQKNGKEPIMASMMQKKEVDAIKKILI